jgi:predicted negative regulator of RcsB-dependent stress response
MAGPYDFEEQERLAELRGWWEDNRLYVILAVAAAVLSYGGWQGWRYWNERQAEDAASMYRPVADAAKGGEPKKILEVAQPLIAKHPGSFYASDAALVAAKAAFDAGSLEEARKQLEWVMDKGAGEHRDVARIRLAAVLLEQKKYDEALKALDGNRAPAFEAIAADTRGDVMLAQGRLAEARSAYKLAMEKSDKRSPVHGIAETKLNALGGAQ